MSKLPLNQRNSSPTKVFKSSIKASILQISSAFLKSETFLHAGTKGSERENPIQLFFKNNLPNTFDVVKGEVVDLEEQHSPQLDIIIYDSVRNFAFNNDDSYLLPAEALLVCIEVKSCLSSEEIKKILVAVNKLKKLKPFKRNLSPVREGGAHADEKSRYFYCVFAYDSDLTKENWIKKEYLRLVGISKDIGIEYNLIDRIYVKNRGIINPVSENGAIENDDGIGLMHFYMNILNFLLRENARRDPAPIIDYGGTLTQGWMKLNE